MNDIALFTDVSLNPKLKLGVGGYIAVPFSFLDAAPENIERSDVAGRLKVKSFEDTSSAKLEVQTVLWALEEYRNKLMGPVSGKLRIYSDSQCVAGLPGRRSRLEERGFTGSRKNCLIKNACLYRKFYELYDELGFEVIKVEGHSRSCSHDTVRRIFSFVDREVRKFARTKGVKDAWGNGSR